MMVSRRLFLASCAAVPALGMLRAVPVQAARPALVVGVGQVWGLSYWSCNAVPAVNAPRRRAALTPPAWHPEFS